MPLPFESTRKAIFCFPDVAAQTTLMDLTAQIKTAFQTLPRKEYLAILNYPIFQVIHKDQTGQKGKVEAYPVVLLGWTIFRKLKL